MSDSTIYQKIADAVAAIQKCSPIRPKIGIVLGSGLGSVADQAQDVVDLPYSKIPHFHGTSVEGHSGILTLGRFAGVETVFLRGRFHLYEGYPMEDIVFPVRVVCALGVQTVILTNAAGGVNTRYQPSDIMIIEDHINLMGDNPLKGPNLAELGPRFPDLTEAYTKRAQQALLNAATELGITVHTGVYAGLLGPTYETPAEVRMLRTLGADAVGMSTVPESIAANHLGVQVAGLSCITNLAAGISSQKLAHEEVIRNTRTSSDRVRRILEKAVPKMVL